MILILWGMIIFCPQSGYCGENRSPITLLAEFERRATDEGHPIVVFRVVSCLGAARRMKVLVINWDADHPIADDYGRVLELKTLWEGNPDEGIPTRFEYSPGFSEENRVWCLVVAETEGIHGNKEELVAPMIAQIAGGKIYRPRYTSGSYEDFMDIEMQLLEEEMREHGIRDFSKENLQKNFPLYFAETLKIKAKYASMFSYPR